MGKLEWIGEGIIMAGIEEIGRSRVEHSYFTIHNS